jgi:hypothetical protein
MQRQWMVALVLLSVATPVNARPDCDAIACDEVKQAIREIESRMRAGYSRAQGERFEARLRKLKRKRSKLCR